MSNISEKQQQLIDKLKELFMMDQADLDFGIYRIMNAKHDEIESFLHKDLLPTIRDTLQAGGKASDIQKELDEAIKNAQDLGADPDSLPKVQELKALLGDGANNNLEKDEDEIFSHLTTFFSRYYEGGDFLSLRRYKQETYSPLPMNGEEVKLHWANADQYYIKSAESFSNYAFKIGTEDENNKKTVRFELVEASTEQNNKKESSDKERRFILDENQPLSIRETDQGNELIIHFSYQADEEKRKQTDLNQRAINFIGELENDNPLVADITDWQMWQAALLADDASYTVKNKKRTILDKYLSDYTAKNSFDYFIHKDLGSFLNRELNFFVKNELLLLDDIVPNTTDSLGSQLLSNERSLKKVIAFKTIAQKLIAFLAQLENFQKKLWLKKKFVLESNYCITLDRIDEKFYAEIVDNQKQIQEWIDLGFMEQDTIVTQDYLKKNPFLMIDTGLFDEGFKQGLLVEVENIDEETDGLLIHSENFQALNLILERYKKQVKHVYIDPPYNTNSTPILYKNAYKHSSWASLMQDRLALSMSFMKSTGVKTVAIDDTEMVNLSQIIEKSAPDYRLSKVTVVHNPKGSITKDFNRTHEYALFITREDQKGVITRSLEENKTPRKMRRWGENSLRTERRLSFYPIYIKNKKIVRIGNTPDDDFHPASKNISTENGEIEIWPIDQNSVERRWNFGLDSINENLDRVIVLEKDGEYDLFLSHELTVPKTVWVGGEYDAGNYGNTLLIDMLGKKIFDFPKSIKLVERCINISTDEDDESIILDYFAGSGTTAHAAININREKVTSKKKYILSEMGNHFDTAITRRIKKAVYSENWKDGKPLAANNDDFNGISHCYKYMRIESYEDVLDNLQLQLTEQQSEVFENPDNKALKEDYLLNYMLDIEAKGSLLSPDLFIDPFNAQMRVVRDSETRQQNIDLVETFNYLLGLSVQTVQTLKSIVEVIGVNPAGDNVLVIWRNQNDTDNDVLDEWFRKQSYNTRDMEFDLIYVNGDNNLPNLRTGEESWKVQLIEEVFQTLMFDCQDV